MAYFFDIFWGVKPPGGLVVQTPKVSFAVLPRGSIAQVEQHAMHGSHEAWRFRNPKSSSKIPGYLRGITSEIMGITSEILEITSEIMGISPNAT